MSASVLGPVSWGYKSSQDGNYSYDLRSLVKTTDYSDGPQTVMQASGLATIGSTWSYGNDSDSWAFCTPEASAKPVYDKEKCRFWLVDQVFSTRPYKRCQDNQISDPLAELPNISGSFVRYQKRLERDRNGLLIRSSSHEIIKGLTRDANRPSVSIEINSSALDIDVYSAMIDTLNDSLLWGLPPRCVKLSNVSFSRKVYGTCSYYYTRKMDFEIRFDTFDEKEIADVGYLVFDTEITDGDPDNPEHYKLAQDTRGNSPPHRVPLDGSGNRLGALAEPVYIDPVEIYEESNFYSLGVPAYL